MHRCLGLLLLGFTVAACGTDVELDTPGGADESATLPPDASAPPMMTPPPVDTPPDFAWVQANVLTPSCATAMCHGAAGHGGLTLLEGRAYAQLINVTASSDSSWTRVVPGDPARSYLMVALGHADGPMPRDGFMPLGAPMLSAEKLDAMDRWIAAGAQH